MKTKCLIFSSLLLSCVALAQAGPRPVSANCPTCVLVAKSLTLSGALTATGGVVADTLSGATATVMAIRSGQTTTGSAIYYDFNSINAIAGGDIFAQWRANGGSAVAKISNDGSLTAFFGHFSGDIDYGTNLTTLGTSRIFGKTANAAGAVGVVIGSGPSYSTAGAKLVSFETNISTSATEKSFVDLSGLFVPPAIATASLPTCDATHLMGAIVWDTTTTTTKVCQGAAGWKTITST